ncbi:CpaF family protein [Haloechinothrix salitolerans]|uniref:CpaF family protein n=1 Tax=Haloechinothrix salitolerans TaxID=926830 RepID=A0ABW2C708_9PSEU
MSHPWETGDFVPDTPAAVAANGAGRRVAAGWAAIDAGTVAEIRGRVAERLEHDGPFTAFANSPQGRARAARHVEDEVSGWVRRQAERGVPPPTVETERALTRAVMAGLSGLGPLEQLLARDDVENIHIHGCDRVFLELADGLLQRWPHPVAESDEALVEMLTSVFAHQGQTSREFSRAHPLGNLRLPGGGPLGARLGALIEVVDRPRVAIRRHRLSHTTLDDLVEHRTLDETLAQFLAAAVRAGCNILVTGGPSAGKTTTLRALCHAIPATQHVITVEDDYELGLHIDTDLDLVTPMEARLANAEGVGEITLDDLLKQALRQSPHRVIVGEVRGGEITAMLRGLGNGAAGGMCTLHARSAGVAFDRIASLGMLGTPPLSVEAASAWTASAIDLIVHVVKVDDTDAAGRPHRRRFVTEVLEVGPVGDAGRPDATRLYSRPLPGTGAAPVFAPTSELAARVAAAGFEPTRLATVWEAQ